MKYPGIILSILIALSAVLPAGAQTDRKEVRQGNHKFRKEDYRGADVDYRRALVKDSTSFAANYNLANTLYRYKDFSNAGKFMEKINDAAAASPASADYYFNKGDIALQMKDYGKAVEAFRQSLLRNPDDIQAKENYVFAKKMLKNQQNGGNGNGNDQNKDRNQDQNKNQNNDQNRDRNQDQNKDQNQNNDRNDQQNPGNQQPQGGNQDNAGQQPVKISPQQAQQMLQAMQAKEKETQDKVNKEKAAVLQSKQKEKNW